jgi:hypothetical protein
MNSFRLAQLNPPNSQISRMIGRGIPSSQSSKPRPIVVSGDVVSRENAGGA